MKPFVHILHPVAVVALVLYWIGLFAATHLPGEFVETVPGNDKVLHALAYCGLAVLLAFVVCGCSRHPWYVYAVLLLIVAAYGAFDEMTQTLVSGRQADLADWLCDLGGTFLGLVVYSRLQWMAAHCSLVT